MNWVRNVGWYMETSHVNNLNTTVFLNFFLRLLLLFPVMYCLISVEIHKLIRDQGASGIASLPSLSGILYICLCFLYMLFYLVLSIHDFQFGIISVFFSLLGIGKTCVYRPNTRALVNPLNDDRE
jgi:hypothetical protein